jgi:NAD(P)-dependent dehydrogenase (short-subunit alcohol dehydrogenase family)
MTLPLASRIALVTGASRGIGYATALALAKAGAHVVAVARTQGGLEQLDNEIRKLGAESATLVPVDLTDSDALARLGASLHERYGKLDVLVSSAGIAGPSSPLGHIALKPWNELIAINLTANFQIIRCMEPLLRKSDAGRALFLAEAPCIEAPAYRGPYAAAQAALQALVRVWAREVAITPIKVNLFDPGPTRTRLRAAIMPGEEPLDLPTPAEIAEQIVPLCLPTYDASGKLYDYRQRAVSYRFHG